MMYQPTVTSYSQDDDDIHLDEIVPGQELRGSVVTKIKVEVKETEDRMKIEKWITMLDGVQYKSLYIKTKAEYYQGIDKPGEISLDPAEIERLKKLHKKDDSDARAKVRAQMEQRKREKEAKAKGLPPPPPLEVPITVNVKILPRNEGDKVKIVTIGNLKTF